MKIILYLTIIFCFFNKAATAQIQGDLKEKSEQLISKIDKGIYQNIDGIAIWQNGAIIGEKYWNGWNRTKPHMLQSVSKSITSLLIGIALHEGYISDVDQKVLSFFPSYKPVANLDKYKKALTIEDLLTMQTGMDWNEHPYQGSNLDQMNSNRTDWIRFVLDTPMKEAPGQNYAYNSGGVILLGGIIKKATGIPVQEFAQKYLFDPLNIDSANWWFSDRKGLPHTSGGLSMATDDMIKIGQLILQKGSWDGIKILNEKYIEEIYQNQRTDNLRNINGYDFGYSYLWHVFPTKLNNEEFESTDKFIAAWGANGQWIFIIPNFDAIVVFIGDTDNFQEETQPINMMYEDLLDTKDVN